MSKGVELPYRIFGRALRPFSLALLIATLVVIYQYEVMETGPGSDGFDMLETIFAASACAMLFFGWIMKNDEVHEWGLVLATGVWAGRMFSYQAEGGWDSMGVWLSFAWIVGAVGAWLLEAYDHRWKATIAEARRAAVSGGD